MSMKTDFYSPPGQHGFALWFSGAPKNAILRCTQFWHPDLDVVRDGTEERFQVASADTGTLKWNNQNTALKGLSLFSVEALVHLLETKGRVPYGYSGCAIHSLVNALSRDERRSKSIQAIFGISGAAKDIAIDVEQPGWMDSAFVIVSGVGDSVTVRLSDRFHEGCTPDGLPAIYLFWESVFPRRLPDWRLTRILVPAKLERLRVALERSYQSGDDTRGKQLSETTHGERFEEEQPAIACDISQNVPEATGRSAEQGLAIATEQTITVARRLFLRFVFHILLGSYTKKYPSSFARSYLADNLASTLPEVASTNDLMELCVSEADVNRSYAKTLIALGMEWQKLHSHVKAEIHNYVTNSALAGDLDCLPPLTIEDGNDLLIRWDIADVDYASKKLDTFARCQNLGCDIRSREIDLQHLDDVCDILIGLLEERTEIDKSHILKVGAKLSTRNLTKMWERTRNESQTIRVLLEGALRAALGSENAPLSWPDGAGLDGQTSANQDGPTYELAVQAMITKYLEPYDQRIEAIRLTIGLEDSRLWLTDG